MIVAVHTLVPMLQAFFAASINSGYILKVTLQLSDFFPFLHSCKAMFPTQTYFACKAVTPYAYCYFKPTYAIKSSRILNFYTQTIKNAFATVIKILLTRITRWNLDCTAIHSMFLMVDNNTSKDWKINQNPSSVNFSASPLISSLLP